MTVCSPQRRVDVALPDAVPIAEILPELLDRAGDDLADLGEQHGGWILRRADGAELPVTQTLTAAGVRDGEVLHLSRAVIDWPEPEYDDVVEAIAARARRIGSAWTGDATRVAAVAASGFAIAVAAFAPVVGLAYGAGLTAVGIGALLLLAGVLASRAYGEPLIGAALAAYSMVLAFVGGLHLVGGGPVGAPHVLVAGAALTVWAVAGAVGVATGLWIFVGGAAAGVVAATGGLVGLATRPAAAAAIVLVAVAVGVTSAPWLAVRLGRLPLPVVTVAGGAADSDGRADHSRVQAAVDRADDMLTGMLTGFAIAAVGSGWILVRGGSVALVLVGVAGAAVLLRARLYVTVRQRLPLLVGGVALLALPVATGAWNPGPAAAPVLAAATIAIAAAGARYRRRPPSPYLGRAADILDALCLVSLVPIAAAILGLYTAVRGLSG